MSLYKESERIEPSENADQPTSIAQKEAERRRKKRNLVIYDFWMLRFAIGNML